MLIGCQDWLARLMFIDTTLRHKDGIVISLSENESCKDDIHDIEFDTKYSHESENPHPTDCHRHEGYYRQFYLTEREPQEEEHDKRA